MQRPSFITNFIVHILNTFNYRAYERRQEYWFFMIGMILLGAISFFVFSLLLMFVSPEVAQFITATYISLMLFLFLTWIGAMIRRLHDAGFSAWFFLLIIPFGTIAFFFGFIGSNLARVKYRRYPLYPNIEGY